MHYEIELIAQHIYRSAISSSKEELIPSLQKLAGLDQASLHSQMRSDSVRLSVWLNLYNALEFTRFFTGTLSISFGGSELDQKEIFYGMLRQDRLRAGIAYNFRQLTSSFWRSMIIDAPFPKLHSCVIPQLDTNLLPYFDSRSVHEQIQACQQRKRKRITSASLESASI